MATKKSQEMFQEFFDSNPDAIVITNREGLIERANTRVESLFGYRSDELMSQPIEVLLPARFRARHLKHRAGYIANPHTHPMTVGLNLYGKRKDGSEFPVDILLSPFQVQESRLVISIVRDITERKQAEEALRNSEEQYRLVVNNIDEVIYSLWTSGDPLKATVAFVSNRSLQILGYTPEEFQENPGLWATLIHPEDLEAVVALARQAYQAKQDVRRVYRMKHKRTGEYIWIEDKAHLLFDEQRNIISVSGSARDITERKQAEEEVERSREQLRALTARLQEAREGERTRIAREIHDELGQALTGLKMDLSWCSNKMATDQSPLLDKANSMIGLVDTTIRTVRRIATELRPGILDDLGLVPAIEWQAQEFEKRSGIKCVLTTGNEDIALDGARTTAVFRIFQESLTNVARHSGATHVNVHLEKNDGHLTLEISDNGKGISQRERLGKKSLGLLGMKERALIIGGELTMTGIEGKGTTVRVTIPV